MIDYAQALNEAQLAAVTAPDGPVLVVAGAGSGKTRTIVYRLAWLAEHGVAPESILLLTFTRKAAREMLQRAGALLGQGLSGVQGGTFHAFAYSVLRRWRPAWLGDRPFTLMDQGDITAAVRQCKARLDLGKGDRSFPKSASVVGFISKARNKELPLSEVLRREAYHLEPYAEQLEKLGEAYAAYKRDNGLMDYDDLLFELEALLRDNAEAAAALRARFRHILVDEYQDTNLVQARIVRLLAGPVDGAGEGGAPLCNVMAVGDEAQSIYAFRGANVRNILDFPKLFPGARILPLEENYRSTRPVLDVANSLLAHAAESFDKRLFTRKEGGEPVRLVTPLSDETQAALVTRRITELLECYAPHEVAVLFRAGRHSFALEAALKRAGIAFRKYGGLRFAEFAHNKDVVAFARLALNPLDLPAFTRIAAMHKGVGPKTVERLYAALRTGDAAAQARAFARYPELADDLRFVEGLRASCPAPVDFFDQVIDRYRPRLESRYPDDWPQRQKDLEELLQIAANYTDLDLFVAEQALESPEEEAAADDGEGRITLSTIHSAKGLEWSAVLLIDLVEDRFPSRHALARPEDFEEERRLMYVACTRARKQLELYAPATIYNRAERGALHTAQSPFVRELAPGLAEEWVEGFGGRLSRRGEGVPRRGAVTAADRGRSALLREPPDEDCQLAPEDWPGAPTAAPETDPTGQAGASPGELCHCRHRIFGRGKIVRRIPPDKAQVNFPGFGLKVILTDYLLMED